MIQMMMSKVAMKMTVLSCWIRNFQGAPISINETSSYNLILYP